MLIRGVKRAALLVASVLLVTYLGLRLCFDEAAIPLWRVSNWLNAAFAQRPSKKVEFLGSSVPESAGAVPPQQGHTHISSLKPGDKSSFNIQFEEIDAWVPYNEVYSVSTKDRKYFHVSFVEKQAINPNIIPHPTLDDTWIIVAQEHVTAEHSHVWFAELVCNAAFEDDVLQCVESPSHLPIAATRSGEGLCKDHLQVLNMNVGPHDARVFYGPKVPYTTYGSNSKFTCFGQWIQDLRMLVPWGMDMLKQDQFLIGTELQRPPPYLAVEKNWFIFWDSSDQKYVHYDVAPKRAFAKLADDGSVGPDLAPLAAPSDEKCLAKYMPVPAPEHESIHQSTNTLAITMCKRSDPSCEENDSNTFLFTIFQHKTHYNYHSAYNPYVMMFRREAPFEVVGISKKPIWIHGREKTEDMLYVVSMSWKTRGQRYHGFLDDVIFLAFGIEDRDTGGIDVVAGDLFRGLGLCSEVVEGSL